MKEKKMGGILYGVQLGLLRGITEGLIVRNCRGRFVLK